MSVTALKTKTPDPTATAPQDETKIVKMSAPSRSALPGKLKTFGSFLLTDVVPPVIVTILLLLLWEILCSSKGATLPPPSTVWKEAKDLIIDPFFVNGSQDIGLGLRVLTSLQRVAVGFGLAAVVGILIGAVVGQSTWAMRGFDPIFQILRTVPPLAWLPLSLAAFRDSQPSAIFVIFITSIWPVMINTAVGIRNIPQDYRNVSAVLRLNQVEFFWRIMIPRPHPISSQACALVLACHGWPLWRLKC